MKFKLLEVLQKGKIVYIGACARQTNCVPNDLVTRKAHSVMHVAILNTIQNLAQRSRKQNQDTSKGKGIVHPRTGHEGPDRE
jgi:hypothetical protein